ncbi:MAG: energy-coupling factor ABC transporter ATP-binding protein [Synergistaceae bacterium]|jgi:cobalt/nickel transport system ATP-binding protein|nr:energy-coupling factor ABC transporter ATP-binding protein [Synergistaceae bacterium]
MTALLEARGLSYAYPDGTPALRGLSFRLDACQKAALVGANGSGKSTLLLHFAGCYAPKSGEILLRGEPVGKNLQALRDSAGMVFQDPDDQLFMPSVAEDVAFGLLARKTKAAPALAAGNACLERLGISRLGSRPPHRLSNGEKRLVAIAGILVMNPEIILLDEPSSSLDPQARRTVISILKELPKPMIIATHDLEMARALCGTAVIMHRGRAVAEGAPDELLRDGKLLEQYGL